MTRQFGRSINVVVGKEGNAIDVSKLRIKFEITKNIMGAPDTCKLEIFNLSRDSQTKVENEFDTVIVNAGYGGDIGLLFQGEIRNVFRSDGGGGNRITQVFAGDADQAYKRSVSNFTLGNDSKINDVIKRVIEDMTNVELGKIDIEAGNNKILGMTYSGASRDLLNQLGKDYNFNWSIQNGFLNCIDAKKPKSFEAVLINNKTGMVGSPTVTARGANVQTLLNWRIEPHGLIKVESETNVAQFGNLFFTDIPETLGKGTYKVAAVTYIGDTHGVSWHSNIEGLNI
jgi:hypothetical protein